MILFTGKYNVVNSGGAFLVAHVQGMAIGDIGVGPMAWLNIIAILPLGKPALML
ncbi:hypothetical protein [Dyadobacter sediminis]|uniref:hypothetical protein n=1 Tax=Dyadobacter sediminis TaxID=1493691 RepID=UPI0019A4A26E|nr:hypothetical protein [Dyadobacter sediminis]GGB83435.1 hypothetical protein GCM10011325_08730 [Dyadobacter sediminis]